MTLVYNAKDLYERFQNAIILLPKKGLFYNIDSRQYKKLRQCYLRKVKKSYF